MKLTALSAPLLALVAATAFGLGGTLARADDDPPVSLNKNCYQSSVYGDGDDADKRLYMNAGNAVKATPAADYAFVTRETPHPWWYVDLGQSYTIGSIKITNRVGCCQERADSLEIFLANDLDTLKARLQDGAYPAYSHNNRGSLGASLEITDEVAGKKARFVGIRLAKQAQLHLAQVEVFEQPALPTNPILNNFGNPSPSTSNPPSSGDDPSFPTMPDSIP